MSHQEKRKCCTCGENYEYNPKNDSPRNGSCSRECYDDSRNALNPCDSMSATAGTEGPVEDILIFFPHQFLHETSDKTKRRRSDTDLESRVCRHCGKPFSVVPNNDFLSGDVCSRKCFESLSTCKCAELLGGTGGCFCGLKASKTPKKT
jgi:hypothetical protein